jgi:hypothetical protein
MVEFGKVRVFVGVDAHSDHCNLKAIARQGQDLLEMEVPTSTEALRAGVSGLPSPVWVMVEAGPMAPMVKWSLGSVVDRVIVCETRENRWIANSEDKSDPADADRLARLLRMGEFKEVHVPSRARQELRELVRLYTKVVGDVTRAKNRIKAKFRQHGVPVTGREVYQAEHREVWLRKLDRASVRFMAETMYQHLDAAEAVRDRLANRLTAMLGHTRAYQQMCSLPGVGAVTASILVAVIDEPERFPDKRKLWKYAGLSVSSPW